MNPFALVPEREGRGYPGPYRRFLNTCKGSLWNTITTKMECDMRSDAIFAFVYQEVDDERSTEDAVDWTIHPCLILIVWIKNHKARVRGL
jgi:spore maturation protein CgeB